MKVHQLHSHMNILIQHWKHLEKIIFLYIIIIECNMENVHANILLTL